MTTDIILNRFSCRPRDKVVHKNSLPDLKHTKKNIAKQFFMTPCRDGKCSRKYRKRQIQDMAMDNGTKWSIIGAVRFLNRSEG